MILSIGIKIFVLWAFDNNCGKAGLKMRGVLNVVCLFSCLWLSINVYAIIGMAIIRWREYGWKRTLR